MAKRTKTASTPASRALKPFRSTLIDLGFYFLLETSDMLVHFVAEIRGRLDLGRLVS